MPLRRNMKDVDLTPEVDRYSVDKTFSDNNGIVSPAPVKTLRAPLRKAKAPLPSQPNEGEWPTNASEAGGEITPGKTYPKYSFPAPFQAPPPKAPLPRVVDPYTNMNPLTGKPRVENQVGGGTMYGDGSQPQQPTLRQRLAERTLESQGRGEYGTTPGATEAARGNNERVQSLRRRGDFGTADVQRETNEMYGRMGQLQTGQFDLNAPGEVVRSTPGGQYPGVRPHTPGGDGTGWGVGNLALGQGAPIGRRTATEAPKDPATEVPQQFIDAGLSSIGPDNKPQGLTRKDVIKHMQTARGPDGKRLTYDQAISDMAASGLQNKKAAQQLENDKTMNALLQTKTQAEISNIQARTREAEAAAQAMVNTGLFPSTTEAFEKQAVTMIMSSDPDKRTAGISLYGRILAARTANDPAAKLESEFKMQKFSIAAKQVEDIERYIATQEAKLNDVDRYSKLPDGETRESIQASITKKKNEAIQARRAMIEAQQEVDDYINALKAKNAPAGQQPQGTPEYSPGTSGGGGNGPTRPGGSLRPKTNAPPSGGAASNPITDSVARFGAAVKDAMDPNKPVPVGSIPIDPKTGKQKPVPGQTYVRADGSTWVLDPNSPPDKPMMIPSQPKKKSTS